VQIGNELGFLPTPVSVDPLVLAPAERADVLVDFRELAGQRVELRSTPLPKGTVNPATKLARSEVMQFRVVTGNAGPDITPNLPNQPPVDPPVNARVITHTLEEVLNALGPPLRTVLDGKKFIDPLSPDDKIQNGATVFWDVVNLTADTHPIHLHLVHFSVISRRKFREGHRLRTRAQPVRRRPSRGALVSDGRPRASSAAGARRRSRRPVLTGLSQ